MLDFGLVHLYIFSNLKFNTIQPCASLYIVGFSLKELLSCIYKPKNFLNLSAISWHFCLKTLGFTFSANSSSFIEEGLLIQSTILSFCLVYKIAAILYKGIPVDDFLT